jgi:hypothetical protein
MNDKGAQYLAEALRNNNVVDVIIIFVKYFVFYNYRG